MGKLSGILLFVAIVFSLGMNVGCNIFGQNSSQDPASCSPPLFNLIAGKATLISILQVAIPGAVAVAAGTLFFPNPYLIFGGISLLFLQFVVMPTDAFNMIGLPDPYNAFFQGIVSLFWVLAVVDFFKVSDT
jgi:hypothetical protein